MQSKASGTLLARIVLSAKGFSVHIVVMFTFSLTMKPSMIFKTGSMTIFTSTNPWVRFVWMSFRSPLGQGMRELFLEANPL